MALLLTDRRNLKFGAWGESIGMGGDCQARKEGKFYRQTGHAVPRYHTPLCDGCVTNLGLGYGKKLYREGVEAAGIEPVVIPGMTACLQDKHHKIYWIRPCAVDGGCAQFLCSI